MNKEGKNIKDLGSEVTPVITKANASTKIITDNTIADTKQLGYDILNSQQNTKVGLDFITDVATTPDGPFEYSSTNMEDYTPEEALNENTIYPIDESGGVTITVSSTTTVTQNASFNNANPTHLALNKIYLNKNLGINIPIYVVDGPSNAYFEGKCNITVAVTVVGGEARSIEATYNIVGTPEWKDIDTDTVIAL